MAARNGANRDPLAQDLAAGPRAGIVSECADGTSSARRDLGRTAPPARLAVGVLCSIRAAMPTHRADGARSAGHPMGSRRVERLAAQMCAMHAMRPQGRDVADAELGGYAGRMAAGRRSGQGNALQPVRRVVPVLLLADGARGQISDGD